MKGISNTPKNDLVEICELETSGQGYNISIKHHKIADYNILTLKLWSGVSNINDMMLSDISTDIEKCFHDDRYIRNMTGSINCINLIRIDDPKERLSDIINTFYEMNSKYGYSKPAMIVKYGRDSEFSEFSGKFDIAGSTYRLKN